MLWRVTTKTCDPKALDFCKLWLSRYDYDSLRQIAIRRGKLGYGIYGWCDYDGTYARPYSLTLHIPGPFPYNAVTKEPPVYLPIDIDKLPSGQVVASHNVSKKNKVVKVKLETHTVLETAAHALIFLFGHELHHYLSAEEQVPTQDTEKNADEYGNLLLDEYSNFVQ